MPRVSKSTATEVASKDGSCKSPKKLPGGSKPIRHRRSVAGCLACRIRGKPCDQQRNVDAGGLTTCKNCSDLKIACIGGFGQRKAPSDQWKFWFRLRVKLYMREVGRVRGIRGWGRSGPDIRKTPLALVEIRNFMDSHHHLDKAEGDNHVNCIFHDNGKCQLQSPNHIDQQFAQLLLSPTITEISSDFSQSPSTPMDFPESPIIPLGHLGEAPLFEPPSPDMSMMSPPPPYHDVSDLSYNAPVQLFQGPYNCFTTPTIGYMEPYGSGSQDTFSSQSSFEEDTFAPQPTSSDPGPLDPVFLNLIVSLLQTNDDASLAGFTQGVFDGEQA